jgi:hypothetical protein
MRISKIKKIFYFTAAGAALAGLIAFLVFWTGGGPRPGRGLAQADLENVARAVEVDGNYARNIKIRMLQNSSAEILGDDVHFHIGAFETLEGGKSRDVCEDFSLIEITVRAEGVAVNGEPVQKKFSRACEHAVSSETVAPVIVTIDELKKFADDEAGFWPEEWYVSEVRISNALTGRSIDIDGYEIIFVLGHPLSVKF